MANYTSNLKIWGSTGEAYPDGYSYIEGEQPVDAWDNFFAYNTQQDIDHLIQLTNDRIETDSGDASSFPSNPESSHLYYNEEDERLNYWDTDANAWEELIKRSGDTMTGDLTLDALLATTHIGNAVYTSTADVPTIDEGEMVYVSDENALYIEDGS
jgi:hypothetical protein